jgi:VWFA-related protein
MIRLRFGFLAVAMLVASAAAADDSMLNSARRTIDVVVSDNHGNHISGLSQSDFQILEDGKPREASRFLAMSRAGDGSDAQPPRNILLAFDETSISLSARRTLVAALKEFVQTRVRPIDRAMVVAIVGVGGVLPGTSWTSKKSELLEALDKVEQSTVGNKGYERTEAERHIQLAINFAQQGGNAGQLMTFDTLMQPARQYANVMQQEARAALGAVADAVSFLGAGPGKKIVILAGGGLSTRPGSDIFQYLEGLREQAVQGNFGPDLAKGAQGANPISEGSRYEITDIVRGFAQSAHDRGIVIYTVDPDTSGSGTLAAERSTAVDNSEEFVGVSDRLSGYQLLSGFTGGLTLTGRGTSPVVAISDDLDNHYLLSYTQTLRAAGTLPKVDVKVLKPGNHVRLAFTGGPETKEAEVQDAVLANQLAAPRSNDLQIVLAKDNPLPDGEGRRVKLRVLIPVKSLKLVQEGKEVIGGFAVYIATADDKGNSSTINRQTHDIRWPADQLEQLRDKTIGFAVEVVMKPGRSQISVGVMDRRSQQTGYAKTSI